MDPPVSDGDPQLIAAGCWLGAATLQSVYLPVAKRATVQSKSTSFMAEPAASAAYKPRRNGSPVAVSGRDSGEKMSRIMAAELGEDGLPGTNR